jgi:chemosensory pili system protein ChpB (putative protein-glutamate methylesterase)
MSEAATRVVLLARPGEACTRLDAALRQAGAEVALIADPVTADPDAALDAKPQAVLVALEPMVEDALDRYDALLSDPGITVIFDEAELAAHREGWDAARWSRHLAAKLHRHDDVLPPGSEAHTDWPDPGPLPPPRADIGELDIATFTGEALERAAAVPRDDGFDVAAERIASEDDERSDEQGAESADDAPSGTVIDTSGLVAAEDMDWSSSATFSETLDDAELVGLTFEAVRDDDEADDLDDAESRVESIALPLDEDDLSLSTADFDEIAEAAESAEAATPPFGKGGQGGFAAGAAGGFGSLSLAEDDTPIAAQKHTGAGLVERNLDEINSRLEGLSLADTDSYGHGPLRGAVLVEAGLGGPDAVRQLLAGVPESFPRPLLVRLQLDGGRYDKLVKQLARASKLPVSLAVAEQPADPGTVYVLSPTMTVLRDRARLVFAEADLEHAAHALYAELPPNDSALLFLSGSSPALVDIAIAQVPDGALVAGQTPDTCYDGAASSALIDRGGDAGTPAELAARLADRWPS